MSDPLWKVTLQIDRLHTIFEMDSLHQLHWQQDTHSLASTPMIRKAGRGDVIWQQTLS